MRRSYEGKGREMPDEGVKDEVPSSLTLRHTFYNASKINRIAWSPDGGTLASASRGEVIQLWDTNTGNTKHTLKGNFNYSITWSPDGKMLASGGIFFLFIWDTKTGELLASSLSERTE
jgi:WD40 repeat protein